jgi:hypothetical protein
MVAIAEAMPHHEVTEAMRLSMQRLSGRLHESLCSNLRTMRHRRCLCCLRCTIGLSWYSRRLYTTYQHRCSLHRRNEPSQLRSTGVTHDSRFCLCVDPFGNAGLCSVAEGDHLRRDLCSHQDAAYMLAIVPVRLCDHRRMLLRQVVTQDSNRAGASDA